MDPFIIGGGTALVLWGFAMLLLLLHVPWSGFFALAVAGITALIGRIWFLMIAFSEDSTVGMLVLWVPFYDLYFLVTNLEETWRPFALNVVGGFLLGLSFCGGAMQNMAEVDRDAGVRRPAVQFADLAMPSSARRLNSAATAFAVSSTV
ncbi:MAG: hypothetical protein ACJ8F7_05110 [Gemmataceae bacterium]